MQEEWPVQASDLKKQFGSFQAVRGVDLAVPKGSIYGVLGPNGAGKTTTLRMLLGIIDQDSGTRMVLGETSPRNASHRIGYLPEERGLYPAMKAREAIAFMGALRGLDWKEGRKRADVLLENAGLGDARDKKIRKLSKGMAQLVQLLGSIVHEPELIVLDEPFSGLDVGNIVNVKNSFKLISESHELNTIMFSTHDIELAVELADSIYVIGYGTDTSGKVSKSGTILKHYDLKQMGLAWNGEIDAKHFELAKEIKKIMLQS